MCGFAGFLNLDGAPASGATAQRMAATLAHRGPDGEGAWGEGGIALGHRRLAVIDLSEANAQPMHSPDGRYVLVYNGEVYNFAELRRELERQGHGGFVTSGDTEVVLRALGAWGPAALSRFNGMFALALWDRLERRLLLARDRYGVKPLYLAEAGGVLAFASEVKAILAHPSFRAEMDPLALVEYLTFQNYFSDRTLFRNVRVLQPGTWMSFGADGPAVTGRYWDFNFVEPDDPLPEDESIEELDRLFTQAVERQLVADVPVGTFLSGGLDTGSIAAVAARQRHGMPSFTIGFDLRSASGLELSFDEREQAEHMSYLFGTEHYEMVLKAGDMERSMAALVRHVEEPRVGQCYPNFYAAKLAGNFCKVVLAGTGGDEIFGGYPWRYYRAVTCANFESYVDQYYDYWQRLVPPEKMASLLAPLGGAVSQVDGRALFRDVFPPVTDRPTRPEDCIHLSLYLESKTFLHGLLTVEDKLGMAHGLETRFPFLDNDLVDFASRLPARSKLAQIDRVWPLNENVPGSKQDTYFHSTGDGKLILRRMLARYVPDEVREGRKQGFSGPDASWFRGESIDFVRRTLMGPDALIFAWLDRATVHSLIEDHLSGRANRRLLVWGLLYLEFWCREFLVGNPVGVA